MKLILVFAAFTLMGQEKLVSILELNIPGQELENPKGKMEQLQAHLLPTRNWEPKSK